METRNRSPMRTQIITKNKYIYMEHYSIHCSVIIIRVTYSVHLSIETYINVSNQMYDDSFNIKKYLHNLWKVLNRLILRCRNGAINLVTNAQTATQTLSRK